MTAAVIFLWASCLYSIARSVLCFLLAASPTKRLLVLVVLLLAASCAHKPQEQCRGSCTSDDKNHK